MSKPDPVEVAIRRLFADRPAQTYPPRLHHPPLIIVSPFRARWLTFGWWRLASMRHGR